MAVSISDTTLTLTPAADWHGTATITVSVTDGTITDSESFILTVSAVNDLPEEFFVNYPSISDTFSTHVDNDTLIQFSWGKSNDVDSDIMYALSIELNFFQQIYSSVHTDISDTTFSVSSNTLDALLSGLNISFSQLYWYVTAEDEEYMVFSDTNYVFFTRSQLNTKYENLIVSEYELTQNYPNPFNPVTTIQFDIPEAVEIRLDVYNILGEKVATLAHGWREPGRYNVNWDASGMASGMYFYIISSAKFTATRKLLLMK